MSMGNDAFATEAERSVNVVCRNCEVTRGNRDRSKCETCPIAEILKKERQKAKAEAYTIALAERLRKEDEKIVSGIPKVEFQPYYVNADDEWSWFFIRSPRELEALKRVKFDPDAVANDFTMERYPEWVAIYIDPDGYGYFVGTAPDIKKKIGDFEVNLKEKFKKALEV